MPKARDFESANLLANLALSLVTQYPPEEVDAAKWNHSPCYDDIFPSYWYLEGNGWINTLVVLSGWLTGFEFSVFQFFP